MRIKDQYKGVEITLNEPFVKRTIKLSTAKEWELRELLFKGVISEDMLIIEKKYEGVKTKKKTKDIKPDALPMETPQEDGEE